MSVTCNGKTDVEAGKESLPGSVSPVTPHDQGSVAFSIWVDECPNSEANRANDVGVIGSQCDSVTVPAGSI